jgi:D-glycero-alpha-D-manno-heptose-7-phosphate kinase
MIISRAPLRVSFGGGGSDLPAFYRKHGGCVLSTSIDKYAFIQIHPNFNEDQIRLKYSETEEVASASQIRHRIFRAVLERAGLGGVEITSMGDIPAGTGMGSSSTFTVALLHAIYAYRGVYRPKEDLAVEACKIEIDVLGHPIGKQDQFASACGGLNLITFHPDDSVDVEPVIMSRNLVDELDDRLHLFYTGAVRDANAILAEQSRVVAGEEAKVRATHELVGLCREMKLALERRDLPAFGDLLHASWLQKKSLVASITNEAIDRAYESGLAAGARGGKLLGAGGGGFLLFYCEPDKVAALRAALSGLKYLPFRMESGGARIVYYST